MIPKGAKIIFYHDFLPTISIIVRKRYSKEIVTENEIVAKLFTEFRSFTTSKHEVGQCEKTTRRSEKNQLSPSSPISSAIIKRRTSFNGWVAIESSGKVVKGMVDRFAKSSTD